MSDGSRYYTSRKAWLLRQFDSFVRRVRPVLVKHLGEQNVAPMIAETRAEYGRLIPKLPYIGGKQPFTQFVIFTALWLAVYRAASARGKTVEQVGELVFEICREFLQSYPAFLTRLMGGVNFSPIYFRSLRKRAAESHQSIYPDDYIYDFIEGDGKNFDYGVDYLQCTACKFLARQGAPELAPYLCPVDILYSESLGWGLHRTMTLAEGHDRCDFRFKRGGSTRVAVPAALQSVAARGVHA